MTDDELKQLVASLAIAHKETEKIVKELAISQQETNRKFQETDKKFQETDKKFQEMNERADKRHAEVEKQMAKTDKRLDKVGEKLDKLGLLVGNIGNNQGDIAEEFFYRSFKRHPVLNNIHFDNVTRHLKNCIKGIEDEYDIVLINGDCVAIIEVKAKAHVNDLEKMIAKKVINFPLLFTHYKDYKLYAGVATLVTNSELIEKARELGLFLITQQGKHTAIVNNGRLLH